MEFLSAFETEFFKGRSGPFRDYLGKYSGRLLILGDSRSVWEDEAQYDKRTHFDTMGVKMAGAVYPRLTHWAHLHPEQWQIWEHLRKVRGGRIKGAAPTRIVHGSKPEELKDGAIVFPCQYGGNSGMFAALVGVALGYDEITLAGCACDGKGHYYDPPKVKNEYSNFGGHEKNWKYCKEHFFFGKVKSLSGNTRVWLNGSD